MSEQLPGPLVPASVDLRDFPKMPLYVQRLRKSETRVRTKPEEFRAAVMLWCAAWHEVPAASLPDDDLVLADLAGYGNQIRAWRKVKAGAMRGFVLCRDGRLYHEVVAEVAIDSWGAQLKQRHRNACDAIKKHNQRKKENLPLPPLVMWITDNCPEGLPYLSRWTREHVTGDKTAVSPGQPPPVPGETLSKVREGSGFSQSSTVSRNDSVPPQPVDNPGPHGPGKSKHPASPSTSEREARAKAEGERKGLTPHRGESLDAYEARVRNARAA